VCGHDQPIAVEVTATLRNDKGVTEFARALVLPDIGLPPREDVLSLLLVWDALDVDLAQAGRDDIGEPSWVDELEDAGALPSPGGRFIQSTHPSRESLLMRSGRSLPNPSTSFATS